MARSVGVVGAEHIAVGLVDGTNLASPVHIFPEAASGSDALLAMHAESIGERISEEIEAVSRGELVAAIGVGFPGIVREGVIEDSPNLPQIKGLNLAMALAASLAPKGIRAPVRIFNDADVIAAGIAATRGQLDRLIRVWTLGNGIGYGRYPWAEGVWEGGHITVTLDPKEAFCGCGGHGHLEGIMGHRAMRLRFLDMEPEEVFANAKAGDARCEAFVKLWHRALAAATASAIHMEGPGKFFISGLNARFLDLGLLDRFVHELVKMSPLQGSQFEVIATGDDIGIIGAAVNAEYLTRGF